METQKTVFISGAGRGLGLRLARSYYSRGWKVYAASRQPSAEAFGDCDPRRLVTGTLDVTDYPSCEQAVRDCLAKCGPIDLLINNASGYASGKIGEYSAGELERELRTTLLGAVNLTNVFVAAHRKATGTRDVVFIASTAGLNGDPDSSDCCVYAAAKAGIIRFAECIGETLRPRGIIPHTLIPTGIREEKSADAVSFAQVFAAIDRLIATGDQQLVLLAGGS
jgi:NAD(P)-dependent dehydrogenase (short-subunit alcohol dehydrogenase family)